MATDRSFKDWLREICVERQTGRLSVTSDHGEGDLFFVGGELYLGPESPVFEAAKAWVDESGMRGAADGAEVLESIPVAGALAFRQLAGMIIEPVQGYGGIVPIPEGYISGAQERVKASGGLCAVRCSLTR